MREYALFVRDNANLLFFGFLLTFFSGYGQTFLISLYIPELGQAFQLSNTGLSSLYAGATLGSAFIFPWVGRYIDVTPLKRFSLFVLVGLAMALLTLSFAFHPVLIILGFWGIRLTGQGLMGHTAVSTMARSYEGDRGKAISLSTLGHPAGEAFFPLLIAGSIATIGWRMTLQLSAASIIVIVLPLVMLLLNTIKDQQLLFPNRDKFIDQNLKQVKNPFQLMTKKAFWIIAPGTLLLPFFNTAILFFQVSFGASRGWTASWVAGSLAFFALGGASAMFLSGPLVDRFTAKRLFPIFIIPCLIGVLLLASFEWPLIYPIALSCLGFANGLASTIKNAILAEVFGTKTIGSVRSLFTTIMVFASALGPITFGFWLDLEVSFTTLLYSSAVGVTLVMLWSIQVLKVKAIEA